jgi:hypothetical protein
VCADCILSKHNKHNFEPVEKFSSKKLDELKGVEARYSQDLTLCQAKVEEFQNRQVIFVVCSVHGILSVIIFGCTS